MSTQNLTISAQHQAVLTRIAAGLHTFAMGTARAYLSGRLDVPERFEEIAKHPKLLRHWHQIALRFVTAILQEQNAHGLPLVAVDHEARVRLHERQRLYAIAESDAERAALQTLCDRLPIVPLVEPQPAPAQDAPQRSLLN